VSRLLLDEMYPPRLAQQLRSHGLDVDAITEQPALLGTSDPAILELATAQSRILFTNNVKDFMPLHTQWGAIGRQHAGLLLVSSKAFPQARGSLGAYVNALLSRQQGAWMITDMESLQCAL